LPLTNQEKAKVET